MTKSPDASMSSETTGTVSLGTAVANAIGTARSGTLSVSDLAPSQSLAQLRPMDTDRRVADALQHISGRRPVFRKRTMFPENGPTYSVTEVASWRCDDADQQKRGLDAVAFSLRPAPEAKITQTLYELRTITRGRVNRDASEDEAEAIIWTQNLSRFPADIVLDTLKNWPGRPDGQWWPTWHDVLKIVEAATIARRMLADHIATGACLPKPRSAKAEDEGERDESPEACERRRAHVEKVMARFTPPSDPVAIVEDYAEWDSRTRVEIAKESRAGRYRLSAEALASVGALPPTQEQERQVA